MAMGVTGSVFEVAFIERDGVELVEKRPVAHLRDEPRALAALDREARFLGLARHAAVPRLVEVGEDGRGPFVIEEHVRGLSIEALIDRWAEAMPFHLAAHVVLGLGNAIRDIHALEDEAGPLALLHGDPSPANAIFEADGTIRWIDFGASRFRGDDASAPRGTGTLPYAAPELCRGEVGPSRDTDTYAVATIAVRLFTGAPLTRAPGGAERLLEIAEHGVDLSSLEAARIPEGVRRALQRLVAFERDAREDDLSDLLASLDPVEAHRV